MIYQIAINTTHQIVIHKVMNGFVVQVGCQQLVFEERRKLIEELDRYFGDPLGVEKEYITKYSNDTLYDNNTPGSLGNPATIECSVTNAAVPRIHPTRSAT